MKIRLDYVSNSSSSSYVVPTPLDRNMPLCDSELFAYRDLHFLDKSEIETGLQWYSGKVDGNAIKVETILCDEHMKKSCYPAFLAGLYRPVTYGCYHGHECTYRLDFCPCVK